MVEAFTFRQALISQYYIKESYFSPQDSWKPSYILDNLNSYLSLCIAEEPVDNDMHGISSPQTNIACSYIISTIITLEYTSYRVVSKSLVHLSRNINHTVNLSYQSSIQIWKRNQKNIMKVQTELTFFFCWFHDLLKDHDTWNKDLLLGCSFHCSDGGYLNIRANKGICDSSPSTTGNELIEAHFCWVVPSKSTEFIFIIAFIDKISRNQDPMVVQLHKITLSEIME